MTGLEIIKAPTATPDALASILSSACPPFGAVACDHYSCRECWLSWLVTGEPPKAKGPSDERTTPDEEGMHPNLAEYLRREKQVQHEDKEILSHLAKREPASQCPHTPQDGEADTLETRHD